MLLRKFSCHVASPRKHTINKAPNCQTKSGNCGSLKPAINKAKPGNAVPNRPREIFFEVASPFAMRASSPKTFDAYPPCADSTLLSLFLTLSI
jgi:hypothetical protein